MTESTTNTSDPGEKSAVGLSRSWVTRSYNSACPCCGDKRSTKRLGCDICGREVCVKCHVVVMRGLTPMCLACARQAEITRTGIVPARLYKGEAREEVNHCGMLKRGECPLAAKIN